MATVTIVEHLFWCLTFIKGFKNVSLRIVFNNIFLSVYKRESLAFCTKAKHIFFLLCLFLRFCSFFIDEIAI